MIFVYSTHASSPYIMVELGAGKMMTQSYPENDTPYHRVSNGYGFAYRLGGGFLWHANPVDLGIESSYASYPKNNYQYDFPLLDTYGIQSYSGQVVDVLLQTRFSLIKIMKKPLNLVGKIGPAVLQQTYSGQAYAFSTLIQEGSSYTAIRPEVVVAVSYQVTPFIETHLNYHQIFADQANPNGVNQQLNRMSSVEYFSAGLNFYFTEN
jgi:hypothetical protein